MKSSLGFLIPRFFFTFSFSTQSNYEKLLREEKKTQKPWQFIKGYCQLVGCGSICSTMDLVTSFIYFNLKQKKNFERFCCLTKNIMLREVNPHILMVLLSILFNELP